MAINYGIKADVVDIAGDTPKASDVFLVDTNVWYWITYTRASQSSRPPAPYQTVHYPAYTNAALSAHARIYQSGLTLAELTHIIEKVEREIYEATNGQIGKKEFRHNFSGERGQVVAEIGAAWSQITALAEPLSCSIDAPFTSAALSRLHAQKVDGYDLFILESMKNHGIIQVLTDDGDFATVPSIQVFTANRNVIQAAADQGKLIIR